MMFIELGFNGVFTFSKEDFPKHIEYIRIHGNDSHKYLFQKEHLWNIAAKRAKYEKLMFVDSDIAPMEDVDWFKQVYDALDKCLFTQGFYSLTYLNEEDKEQGRKRTSYTHQVLYEKSLKQSVPGGVYCINKDFLQIIGYFNYLPFGGGDNLFWYEMGISGSRENFPWFIIFKRDNISDAVEKYQQLTNKTLLSTVFVDIYHFYHGEFKSRSYRQRHYMMMTQFPLMDNIITEDEQGLLTWIDTNHYFYGVMSKLSDVKDNKFIAGGLLNAHMDYLGFVKEFEDNMNRVESSRDYKVRRFNVVKKLKQLIDKYSHEV